MFLDDTARARLSHDTRYLALQIALGISRSTLFVVLFSAIMLLALCGAVYVTKNRARDLDHMVLWSFVVHRASSTLLTFCLVALPYHHAHAPRKLNRRLPPVSGYRLICCQEIEAACAICARTQLRIPAILELDRIVAEAVFEFTEARNSARNCQQPTGLEASSMAAWTAMFNRATRHNMRTSIERITDDLA
ncbi:hypothetical protein RhiJN_21988 [Ceratobasidium sp. AG-Ba]|nr:hypothetical protein RhiJN_21988 [Ceratobasidium sp. AG-Ba]